MQSDNLKSGLDHFFVKINRIYMILTGDKHKKAIR